MDSCANFSEFETNYRKRRSLCLSIISSAISRRSSLYDSIASLNLNVSGIIDLNALQLEDIVAKNREISDFISNRLTALIYFSSQLAAGRSQCRSVNISDSSSDSISEESQEGMENLDTVLTETVFVKDICKKIVKLARCYEEKERQLAKNREEIKNLENELAELNDGLIEFTKNLQETKIEVNAVYNNCRCEVI